MSSNNQSSDVLKEKVLDVEIGQSVNEKPSVAPSIENSAGEYLVCFQPVAKDPELKNLGNIRWAR